MVGPGATWTNSGDLSVGRGGIGTLSVAGGGTVSNIIGYVAYAPDSEGYVTVTGTGSKWTSTGNLDVGRQGDGTLRITDGGDVTQLHWSGRRHRLFEAGDRPGEVTVNGPARPADHRIQHARRLRGNRHADH